VATVQSFALTVYPGKNLEAEPAYAASGGGGDWGEYTRIRVPGFDSHISLNLETFWRTALEGGHRRYQATVTGLETIHKFGEQSQLRETFTAVVTIEYAE
jgi:hypothetical protein